MAHLVFSSSDDTFSPITLNLSNVDLCRYTYIDGSHYVRVIFSSGQEDLILFALREGATNLVTAVSSRIGDPSDTCHRVYDGEALDDGRCAQEYIDLFQTNQKILAIKRYRGEFGLGLKEAKIEIEAMMAVYERGQHPRYPNGRMNHQRAPYV